MKTDITSQLPIFFWWVGKLHSELKVMDVFLLVGTTIWKQRRNVFTSSVNAEGTPKKCISGQKNVQFSVCHSHSVVLDEIPLGSILKWFLLQPSMECPIHRQKSFFSLFITIFRRISSKVKFLSKWNGCKLEMLFTCWWCLQKNATMTKNLWVYNRQVNTKVVALHNKHFFFPWELNFFFPYWICLSRFVTNKNF